MLDRGLDSGANNVASPVLDLLQSSSPAFKLVIECRRIRGAGKVVPMSRSEESIPWTKMMHLMVNSRQVPEKKTSSVNETPNEGLVAFALNRQESDVRKPQQLIKRRSFKYPEPDSVPSPRNFGEELEHGVAHSANGDGEGSERKKSRRRHFSLDAPHLDTIRLGPTLTTSLSFKEPRSILPMRAKLTADESTGKFAYISLDGRLINAELATSVTTIGGKLGDEEARAWEDFAPMQRVLIVAVAAAAAAAAKHRNTKEIDRLLKTVENRVLRNRQHRILTAIASFFNIIVSSLHTFFWTLVTTLGVTSLWTMLRWAILMGRLKLLPYMMCSQEKELISLSQELNEICKLSNTHASRYNPEPFWGSSKTPATQQKLRRIFDGDNVKVNLSLQEGWSSTKYVAQPTVESSSCRSDLFRINTSPVSDEVKAKEEAKWYVNPMVESSQDSDDISTPERCNSLFSPCNPNSFELRSSSGSRETDVYIGLLPLVYSPLTTPTQTTAVSTSSFQTRSQVVDDGAVHTEYKPMRALCAAVVLDLMKRILSVLEKEASMVIAALDTSVKDAKIQVASMSLVIASYWNNSLSKALAALSLSPSEFDSYLLNEAQGTSPWNDVSRIEENTVAWRQYLKKNYGAEAVSGKSPNKLKLSDEVDVTELVKQLQSKEVEISDLKQGQKALLEAKNKEIEELKENLKRGDDELEKLLVAADTSKIASADRLATLEELCREKDSTISDLKLDIQSLKSKVQKSRVYQSQAVPRSRRYSTSSTFSSSSGHGTSQKQRFSDKYAPSSGPGSDPILEYIGRFRKEVPSNEDHFRNLPHLNTDLRDDGRLEHGYDQETSLDYSSTPGSTIGDDRSINSLVFSETEVESRFGSEYCSSGDDSRCCSSKDRIFGTKGPSCNWTFQKQKSMSSDLRRAVTSSASSVRSLTRTQNSKSYTSATSGSKTATGERSSTKPLHKTLSGEIKVIPKSPGSSTGSSPPTSKLKGLGSVAVIHRRSSSLDMNFKSDIPATLETSGLSGGSRHNGPPHSQGNSATSKRKQWV